METIKYNKAVRDKIPEIIKNSEIDCDVKELPDSEFLEEIEKKLDEEVNEYLKDRDPSELADIIEVVYRIAELRGLSNQQLEEIRLEKAQKKGSFKKNLFLIKTSKD